MDRDSIELHYVFSFRDSHVPTFVGTGKVPRNSQLLFFGNDIFDREAQIRETRQEPSDRAFIVSRTNGRTRGIVVMKSVAGRDYFVHDFESPVIPDFSVEPADNGFVFR